MLIRRSCFTSTALSIILAAASSSISWKRTFVLYSRSIPIALVVHNGFYQTTHCTYFDLTFTLSFTKAFSHTPMSLSQLTSSNIPSQPDSSRNRPNNNNPPRNRNLLIRHAFRKLPSQEPQRIQSMEFDSRLNNPR
jgi:hypothetical protein